MTAQRVAALATFNVAAVLLVVAFASLAAWQAQRRAWKLDLMARVEARVHAEAVPAPARERWPGISAASDEYRRVIVAGHWLDARPVFVQALTEIGGGYWVLSPFARDDGTTVLINRGFVPADKRASISSTPAATASVTGKLRLSEPEGGFLRSNDPAADKWFSRDVAAIARTRGMQNNAPYFIDAERAPGQTDLPIAGLTVLSFSNNHLIYLLIWAALALMTAAAAVFVHLQLFRSRNLRPH